MKKSKHRGELIKNPDAMMKRVMIGIPLTGLVRVEWMMARYGQIIPVNWSAGEITHWIDQTSPLGYTVADARNIVVNKAVTGNWEWLFFIDHDVILPPNTFIRMGEYIADGKNPVICGLYSAKGNPPEPLIFRGRGNSWYRKWKLGDKVWADGIPMGCTLISGKLLKAMWEDSEEYNAQGQKVRRVFHTPRIAEYDPVKGFTIGGGTEDIWWCDRILRGKYLEKAGFPEHQKMKYPFLVDTSLKCGHIDWNGVIF